MAPSEQTDFWENQFVEPAGLLLSGGIRESDVVDGDEPVEVAGASSFGGSSGLSPPRGGRDKRRRAVDDDDVNPKKLATVSGYSRIHTVDENGHFAHHRQDRELCRGFQLGKCATTHPGTINCPSSSARVHQCNKCLALRSWRTRVRE